MSKKGIRDPENDGRQMQEGIRESDLGIYVKKKGRRAQETRMYAGERARECTEKLQWGGMGTEMWMVKEQHVKRRVVAVVLMSDQKE
jgi:hypothetical protein